MRVEPLECAFVKVTTHGAAPPRLPKPHLRGQGLFCPDSGKFLLLSSLPDLLTVRAVARAQGLCPWPVPASSLGSAPSPLTAVPGLALTAEKGRVLLCRWRTAFVGRACGVRAAVTARALACLHSESRGRGALWFGRF